MANLYEIDNQILECVDLETGEIIDEDKLSSLQLERESKIEGIALWYKNLVSDAAEYEREKVHFANKQHVSENKAESLKIYLNQILNGEKFKTIRTNITYRKSESVEIIDLAALADDYLKFKEPEPNKIKIKESIKQGIIVQGTRLNKKKNISIK